MPDKLETLVIISPYWKFIIYMFVKYSEKLENLFNSVLKLVGAFFFLPWNTLSSFEKMDWETLVSGLLMSVSFKGC